MYLFSVGTQECHDDTYLWSKTNIDVICCHVLEGSTNLILSLLMLRCCLRYTVRSAKLNVLLPLRLIVLFNVAFTPIPFFLRTSTLILLEGSAGVFAETYE